MSLIASPDGKLYQRYPYEKENEFERDVVAMADQIFGPATMYIDVKRRLTGKGIVNVPDGYLLDMTQAAERAAARNIDAFLYSAVYSPFHGLVIIDEARPELHHVLEKINADISVLEFRAGNPDAGSLRYSPIRWYSRSVREIERIREILEGLSSKDLALRLQDGEIALRPRRGQAVSLPLRIIRERGPDAADQISPEAFNLFIDAGPRLTKALRETTGPAKALATSTGLLKLRLRNLFVDVERPMALPEPKRRGPKIQGLSELVAEALVRLPKAERVPPLTRMVKICAGALGEGPSVAQIQKVLARLEEEDLLKADRTRGPKFTRYFDVRRRDLLLLWAKEHRQSVTRTIGLYVTARDPDSVLALIKRTKLGGRWAVAGPAAAQLWKPILTTSPRVEVWLDDQAFENASDLGARVDDDVANLIIRCHAGGRQPLWFAHHQRKAELPLISPARAYVETASRAGPRLDELADALLESIA